MSEEREDKTIYKVVMNHEEQYSIWPADRENALGWNDAGKTGTKEECLAYIKEVWTDMRPQSCVNEDEIGKELADQMIMPGQFEVMIERNFSSAHQLRGYRGKCENLHGHNYKIEIYARGSELNNIGLLVDFVELKEAADDLVTYLDHKNLNELEPFVEEQNPSAENVARFVLEKLAAKINDDRVQIYKVRCFETPTSVATYQVD